MMVVNAADLSDNTLRPSTCDGWGDIHQTRLKIWADDKPSNHSSETGV